jgi:hypothetical protein
MWALTLWFTPALFVVGVTVAAVVLAPSVPLSVSPDEEVPERVGLDVVRVDRRDEPVPSIDGVMDTTLLAGLWSPAFVV